MSVMRHRVPRRLVVRRHLDDTDVAEHIEAPHEALVELQARSVGDPRARGGPAGDRTHDAAVRRDVTQSFLLVEDRVELQTQSARARQDGTNAATSATEGVRQVDHMGVSPRVRLPHERLGGNVRHGAEVRGAQAGSGDGRTDHPTAGYRRSRGNNPCLTSEPPDARTADVRRAVVDLAELANRCRAVTEAAVLLPRLEAGERVRPPPACVGGPIGSAELTIFDAL